MRAETAALAVLLGLLAGCRQDMHDQPKYEPLEASAFYADGRSARQLVPGTVARGQLREDRAFFAGLSEEDQFITALPLELSVELAERGRNRYDAFCSPCHGRQGDGRGMIVRRGFKEPTSFHEARLRDTPVGYFFDVMTRGFGEMSSYAAQLSPRDRWAIVAYIRALQLSQNAPVAELRPEERQHLEAGETAPPAETETE